MAINPKIFRQVRKALGLTQQALADQLGLSRVTINKMERGRLARGIPDDVGAKLLELKTRAGPKGPRNPEQHGFTNGLWRLEERDRAAQANAARRDDSHLWDNEEDES